MILTLPTWAMGTELISSLRAVYALARVIYSVLKLKEILLFIYYSKIENLEVDFSIEFAEYMTKY